MENTQESALQYAQRLDLFQSHKHDAFSPRSCLRGLQNSLNDSTTPLLENESLWDIIDLPDNTEMFEQEILGTGMEGGQRHTGQTRSTTSDKSGTMLDLLFELPDMGPGSSTTSEALSIILSNMPKNCLVTEYLPLISVDHQEDECLHFPPHIDRLHQALLYKVNNEQLAVSEVSREAYEYGSKTRPELFDVHETAVTPLHSPKIDCAILENNSKFITNTDEPELKSKEPSFRGQARQHSLNAHHRGGIDQQAIEQEPRGATSSKTVSEAGIQNSVEYVIVKDASREQGISPPEANMQNPSNSFFEDALFGCSEHDSDGDMEMRATASLLDRIDSILLPLPKVPTFDLSHIAPDRPTLPNTLEWWHHNNLSPLPLDQALEETLPWAPLPPRRGGLFEEETIQAPDMRAMTNARENGQSRIGTIGGIQDGEIEECQETKKPAKPEPPPPNSLDSLIKLRLQRSASERAQSSSASILPPQYNATKSILPSMDDPGATSKLVSAFMSLRGVKPTRSNIK